MHLFAPDILQAAQGLSLVPCVIAILLGATLWIWGWRLHRFWIVFVATLAAGIYGLSYGPTHGTPSLVAGLLMGIAAGALALDSARLIAFSAGAVTVMMLARRFLPNIDEPFVFCFLGGFAALLLYRYWMMALFSFLGTLIFALGTMCLWHQLKNMDMVAWSLQKAQLVDTYIILSTVVGLMIQFYLERRDQQKGQKHFGSSEGISLKLWQKLRFWKQKPVEVKKKEDKELPKAA